MAVQTKQQTARKKAANRALGQRLATLRKSRGLSQQELAGRVGIVQVLVSDYECGKLRLSADLALRFASALGIPVGELLQDTPGAAPARPAPSRRLLRRLESIERLPPRQQAALLQTIDTFLKGARQAS